MQQRIQAFVKRLKKEDVNMHGFLLSVNGREKVKAYYAPFREGQPHRMYSVSKTLTGIAIGMLIDEGKLSLDSRITDFFFRLAAAAAGQAPAAPAHPGHAAPGHLLPADRLPGI